MKFAKPEAEITYFETADVVETSGTTEAPAPTTSEAPAVTSEAPAATNEPAESTQP